MENDNKPLAKTWACYISAILSVAFLVGTGLVPQWGRWYSDNLAYRFQTDALLHGALAIDTTPCGGRLQWDMLWSEQAVHQVWGLGVPIWRFPFELIAHLVGFRHFPDRFAFAAALAIVSYAVLRAPIWIATGSSTFQHAFLYTAAGLVLLVFFPPFTALCRTRFNVYEEAEAYAFLAGILLLVMLVIFHSRPVFRCYIALALYSGLLALVRPTLIFYSGAAFGLAVLIAAQLGWRRRDVLLGIALFCAGGGLLFLTNLVRFGSGFEFGHSLNLNNIDVMRFASRFGSPFQKEPVLSAARELFSSLFTQSGHLNGYAWYEQNFFHGQSPTIRWREFYFETYGFSYLVMIAATWIWLVTRLLHRVKTRYWKNFTLWEIAALWSILSSIPMAAFYLRFPFMTSRYLLDFGPSFAVAIVVFVNVVVPALAPERLRNRSYFSVLLPASVIFWCGFKAFTASIHPAFNGPSTLTRAELQERLPEPNTNSYKHLPREYTLGSELDSYGIPFNCAGWNTQEGNTKAAVAIFVENPGQLEIELAPASGITIPASQYSKIRAKVGLEPLRLITVREKGNGATIIFDAPTRRRNRLGLQVVFLGFVTGKQLDQSDSPFRLLRVKW
jgi:hypothetical protein